MRLNDKIWAIPEVYRLYSSLNDEVKSIIDSIMNYLIDEKFNEEEQKDLLDNVVDHLINLKRESELQRTNMAFNIRN